ncbi:MAG: hypothetical protein ACOZF2_12080 [Thermodesulfobacteriota bacterium]
MIIFIFINRKRKTENGIKRPQDLQAYQERAASWGLLDLPAVVMVADICRPELLFDTELQSKRYYT